ncbi:MAG TPA: hypothetical protein VGA19_02605 [Rhodospirillales bacterium]|jgi:hypothetical protein
MKTFDPIARAGDPSYDSTSEMYAGLQPLEAELAAHHAENLGPSSDVIWDDVVAMVFRLDSDDDEMQSLKDELELFRRENDFDLD